MSGSSHIIIALLPACLFSERLTVVNWLMQPVLLADLRSTSEKVESLLRKMGVSVKTCWGERKREEAPAVRGMLQPQASVTDVCYTNTLGGSISSDGTLSSRGVESLMLSFLFCHSSRDLPSLLQ